MPIKSIIKNCLYIFFSVTAFIYFGLAVVLFYIGPWETKCVMQNLKNYPGDVVVSLATTPYRINTIRPVLDSIKNQSIKPARIYLNIPLKSKIYAEKEYIIPTWLKTYPNIIINKTKKDYGPATKLIPTLQKEHNINTIIVTVDDDKIYPKHVVRDLIKYYLPSMYKNDARIQSVITGLGISFLIDEKTFKLYLLPKLASNQSLTIHGSYGVAYKRKFFNSDIFDLTDNLPITCFLTDDLMIPGYLATNHINIISMFGASFSYNPITLGLLFKESPSFNTMDSISRGANGKGKNNEDDNVSDCLEKLPNYNKINFQKNILQRSKEIGLSYQKKTLFNYVIQSYCYYLLKKIIYVMPFMKKIIITTMS